MALYDPSIASPRPHRTDNPAADLNELAPPAYAMSPAGPAADWSPWAFPTTPSFAPPPAPPTPAMPPNRPTPAPSAANPLTAAFPSIPTLLQALPSITAPHFDPALKINWARDVFFLADRAHHLHLQLSTPVGQPVPSVSDPIVGPMPLAALDPDIVQLLNAAVPLILAIGAPFPPGQAHHQNSQPMEAHHAEAVYLRAVLASTGAHPQYVPFNPKSAFRDFESAARGGYAGAWFRLGRDYENFGDFKHAKECFERGAKLGVEACLYRLGMAHLLGQLTLPPNTQHALPILHRAAILASLECPQPAYVYSLLLLNEFSSIPPIPAETYTSLSALSAYPPPQAHPSQPLQPLIPLGSSPHLESRHHLERAAYLHYGPAQYKLGHAYEFADPPFFFDPLLSVQYYSLASQNGEVEADMALSKWFLCGSGSSTPSGSFEKDEALALTFAQKASSRNLSSAHFAMGYYAEVGVGRPPSVPDAIHYYTLAWQSGNNADARARLDALKASNTPRLLDKAEQEQRLVRTRTMAQRRTEEQPMSPPFAGRTFPNMREGLQPPSTLSLNQGQDPRAVVELVRKNTMATSVPLQSVIANNNYAPAPPNYPSSPPNYASPPSNYSPQPPPPPPTVNYPPPQPSTQYRPTSASASAYPPSGSGRMPTNIQQQYPSPQSAGARPNSTPYSPTSRYDSPGLAPSSAYSPQNATAPATPLGGGRRTQSPARRPSPGPGRQGKLTVGVDSTIPPVPPVPSGVTQNFGTTPSAPAPSNASGNTSLNTPRPAGKHPATFAEMGIQGAKAEEKDCVIM